MPVRSPYREGGNESAVRESVGWKGQSRVSGTEKPALQEEAVSNCRYYIVGNNDVWMIQFKDSENGQYRSSNDAISFAIAVAQKLGMRGERAHVCMLDDDARLRCKWSYNRDRHPRSGNKRLLDRLTSSH